MGLFKVTWFFEGLQQAVLGAGSAVGWTETWGLQTASDNIDDVFTNNDVKLYTSFRQGCLSQGYRMSFIRASNIQQPPTVSPRRVKVQALTGIEGAASLRGQKPAQVQCCVLADMQKLPTAPSDKVHHRKFLLRGLPPDVINGNVINPSATNWPAIINFLNFVANKPTGEPNNPGRATMLGVIYQDQVNFPAIACPALTVDPTAPRNINFDPGLTVFVPGDVIRIRGFKGLDGVQYNRAWTWIQTNAGPPQKAYFGKSRFDLEPGTTGFPTNALLQRVRFVSGPFDQYAVIGLRSKRTGKVFHQLRGRSAVRVRP